MSDPADLSEQIAETAAGPASVSVDGLTVSAQPLKDLIEADEYLQRRDQAARRRLPIRMTKIRPGGAAG